MGDQCCQAKVGELSKLRKEQAKVLWIILLINAVMFVVELGAGIQANSLSLTGDSLDMLSPMGVVYMSLTRV